MQRAGWISAGVALLMVIGRAAPARADIFHYDSQLLGGRAGGMGGAVVGMPEDDASGYYNPAAFLRGSQVKASVSATAIDIESLTYLSYLGGPATASSAGLIPNASVASSPWRDGRFSFSVFTTDSNQLSLNRSFTPPASSGLTTATLRQSQSGSTYLLGPSLGVPLSPTISIGFSVFFVYGSQTLLERVYQEGTDGSAYDRTVDSSEVSTGVVVVAGVQFRPEGASGRATFGIAVRSGTSLADQANRQEQDLAGVVTASGQRQLIDQTGPNSVSVQGQGGIPSQVSAGSSLRLGPGRLDLDVTAISAQQYTDLGVSVDKRFTINAASGYEWSIGPDWFGRVGLFTDRSSAPATVTPTSDGEPHVDYYGVTLGLSQLEPHHTLDAALKFAYGYGNAAVEAKEGTFDVTAVRGYDLTVTIGGSFRL